MARSLNVHPNYLQEVNLAWQHKCDERGKDFSEELGLSLRLVILNLFLKGEPVNYVNFIEICQLLGLNWRQIAGLELQESPVSSSLLEINSSRVNDARVPGSAIALSRPVKEIDEIDRAINDLVGTLCEMLRRLTRKAGNLLRADRTSIFLLDRETNTLGSLIADDGSGGCLLIDIPGNSGIAGIAAATAQAINVPFDVYDDPRSAQAKNTDQRTGYRTYTILAWPLFNERRNLIAVVQLINKLKSNFDPQEDLSERIDKKGFTKEDEAKVARFAPSILKILEKCQFCYQLSVRVRSNIELARGGTALQNATLIAELKRQEQQLRKSLEKI